LHDHRQSSAAKIENFWSIRAGRDIRVIVHKDGCELDCCATSDHHDAAYGWAERMADRRLRANPVGDFASVLVVSAGDWFGDRRFRKYVASRKLLQTPKASGRLLVASLRRLDGTCWLWRPAAMGRRCAGGSMRTLPFELVESFAPGSRRGAVARFSHRLTHAAKPIHNRRGCRSVRFTRCDQSLSHHVGFVGGESLRRCLDLLGTNGRSLAIHLRKRLFGEILQGTQHAFVARLEP